MQIIANDPDNYVWALANDGAAYVGWYVDREFAWQDKLPDLPQGDAP